MKIVVGVLAWNEESSIGVTLGSLASQTLLAKAQPGILELHIIVVPNGCTDRTAAVAREALAKIQAQFPAVQVQVEELAEGGKSRAWNELIHRIAPQDADYYILMDADIELLTPKTLEALWQTLEDHPEATLATDLPVKHLVRKARLSLLDRILLGAGQMTQSTPGQLTGQLYAARGAKLRQVIFPRGIIVEDGFLKQILCTDGYSHPVDNSLIRRAENASHLFECYTRLGDIWNHQVRQAIGHTLYTYFTAWVKECAPERPVYEAVKKKCTEDPEWFLREIRRQVEVRGWWVMDRPSLWMRWRRAKNASGWRRWKFFLLAAVAFPYDLAVFLVSNHRLRSGKVKGLWKDTRTTTLQNPASS